MEDWGFAVTAAVEQHACILLSLQHVGGESPLSLAIATLSLVEPDTSNGDGAGVTRDVT